MLATSHGASGCSRSTAEIAKPCSSTSRAPSARSATLVGSPAGPSQLFVTFAGATSSAAP